VGLGDLVSEGEAVKDANADLGAITLSCLGCQRGVWFYAAFCERWQWPVGVAWATRAGCHDGRTVSQLGDIYVPAALRRHGVATRLVHRILEDCDVVVTASGSPTGGELLLKAMGFRWNQEAACWSLAKAPPVEAAVRLERAK
jgi:GNAT superfamily N-acetyltransferase